MQYLDYSEICEYVNTHLFNTGEWEQATEQQRTKAINQAGRTLLNVLGDFYKMGIPVEHIAEQSNWIVRVDNMVSKAEMGVTSISIDGMSVSLAKRDNSICPFVLDSFGLPSDWATCRKRKVGRYQTTLFDSNRKGWF